MVTGDSKWFNEMDGEQALPSGLPDDSDPSEAGAAAIRHL